MSVNNTKRRKCLSLSEKMDIIIELKKNPSQSFLSKKLGIPTSTVNGIWKEREKIEADFFTNNVKTKKIRTTPFKTIDDALLQWFKIQRNRNLPMSGPILMEKAQEFAKDLGLENFKCSNGWFDKWKKRHDIVFKAVSGESAAVNLDDVSKWLEEKWKPISSTYEPKNIFNCDETGLFWRLLPDRSLTFVGEKCSGGKHSKERITVLLCCNQTGTEKLRPLVIGKSAKPRAFSRLRSVQDLPVKYQSNKKAWMTTVLFEEWLKEIDIFMRSKNRKILLILDNCPSHPHNIILANVKLLYLPPNTTSVSQPLDQGIIQNFKVHYRKRLLRKVIQQIDRKESAKIDILDSILYLDLAWNDVTETTINNCFRKAGLFSSSDVNRVNCEVEEIVEVNSIPLQQYLTYIGEPAEDYIKINDYVGIDDCVTTSCTPSEMDILDSLANEDQNDPENLPELEVDEDEEELIAVSVNQAVEAVETLKRFVIKQAGHCSMMKNLDKLEEFCFLAQFQKSKQSTMLDFFPKTD